MITTGRLLGKVAIVTGGATGIGEAISKRFALEGAHVLVCGYPDDPVAAVVQEIRDAGGQALPFMADISDQHSAETCVAVAIENWGHLDILINNAGVLPEQNETDQYSLAAFDSIVKNNIRSTFMMTRAAIPYLQKTKGCIVSAGSEAGVKGLAEFTPYGGSKAFVHGFTLGVAVEQAKYGVRANCVCPGPIDTSMTRKEHGAMDKKTEQMTLDATPMGRRGTTEEVANVYLFLASDEASFVTGSLYGVDGGIVAAKGAVGAQAEKEVKAMPENPPYIKHEHDGKPERK